MEVKKDDQIVLLLGTESFLRESYCKKYKELCLAGGLAEMNFAHYYKGKGKLQTLIEEALNLPFMAEKRILQIDDLDRLDKKDCDEIEKYLSAPPPTTLLLLSAEKLDKRTKLGKALLRGAKIIPCDPYTPEEMKAFLQADLKNQGKSMTDYAQNLLLDSVGNHLQALKISLEQLVTYVATKKEINEVDVQDLLFVIKEENIFEMVEAISIGNLALLKKKTEAILRQGEAPQKILALVLRHFNILLLYKYEGEREVQHHFRMPYTALRKYEEQARKLGKKLNLKVYKKLSSIDRDVKMSGYPMESFKLGILSLAQSMQ